MVIPQAGGSLFFMSRGGTSHSFKWLSISIKLKLATWIISFSTRSTHSYWITCHIFEVQLWARNLRERLARRECPFHKDLQMILYWPQNPFHGLLSHGCTCVCPVYSLTQKRSHKTGWGGGCRFLLFHYCLTCHLTYMFSYSAGLGRVEGLVWNLCCFQFILQITREWTWSSQGNNTSIWRQEMQLKGKSGWLH